MIAHGRLRLLRLLQKGLCENRLFPGRLAQEWLGRGFRLDSPFKTFSYIISPIKFFE